MNQSHTALIADDDADLVQLLARHCRRMGIGVDTAHDARTALSKIAQSHPDFVILDITMPGGNGLSVREMMADDAELSSIPVIILTGRSDDKTLRRCHNAGAYYVAKCPNVWSRIEPVVRELLGWKEQLVEPATEATPAAAPPAPAKPTVVTTSPAPAETAQSPYEDSDQKTFFDWIFDLMGDGDAPLPEGVGAASLTTSGEPPWVLCIDDDSELSFGLQLRLQEQGVAVLRAFSGMEGYSSAFISNPRAIILDFEMPGGNGDYVLRRLKETPATWSIPVIVLTGRNDRAVERTMFNLGASEFLTKPCPWTKLWPLLQKYLEPAPVA